MSEATDAARRFLQLTIDDIGRLAEVYADEVVIEMPFAAGIAPTSRRTTRAELEAQFTRGDIPRFTSLTEVNILECADPSTAVLEYRLNGTRHDGQPFANDYVMVITTRDGRIVHSRDYSNPVQAAQNSGRVDQLIQALRGSGNPAEQSGERA
ncbi:nuclear transport factor 2 family protein [Humibacter antri]